MATSNRQAVKYWGKGKEFCWTCSSLCRVNTSRSPIQMLPIRPLNDLKSLLIKDCSWELWWSQEASREVESTQGGHHHVGPKQMVFVAQTWAGLEAPPELAAWWLNLPVVSSCSLWDSCDIPFSQISLPKQGFIVYISSPSFLKILNFLLSL